MCVQDRFIELSVLNTKILSSIHEEDFETTALHVSKWVKNINILITSLSTEQFSLFTEELNQLVIQHQQLQIEVSEQRAKTLTQLQSLQHANAVKMHYKSAS